MPDCLTDDIVNDICWRIIYPSGPPNLGLVFNASGMTLRKVNYFPQKLLVDMAQNIGRDDGKDVGAFRVIQVAEDFLEDRVVHTKPERQSIRSFVTSLLSQQMEQSRIVAVISTLEISQRRG